VVDKQKLLQFIKDHSVLFVLLCILVVASPPFKPVRDFAYSTFYLFSDDKQGQIGNEGSSVTGRLGQLNGVIEIVGSYILQGLGYGFSSYREGTSINFEELYGLESYAFKIMVHSGLIGLLCWIMFFYKLFKSSFSFVGERGYKYCLAFYLSYLLAILMTDTSGSFFLFLVFVELNCLWCYYEDTLEAEEDPEAENELAANPADDVD
jgi:hypothetical protein